MARRKKSSVFDDLLDVASLLPWQVDVVLAVVIYLWLHHQANVPNVPPIDPKAMGAFVGNQLFITFSSILQYLVPVILLIGAGVSAFNRKHRKQLVEQQSGIESIRAMSWQDFELLVGEAFRLQGYAVEERGGTGPDGGVDLVLFKGGQSTVVQCKRWKSYSVGVSPVRELYGVMTAEKAAVCVFVTSGTYTADAVSFAKGKPIRLIDGDELVKLLRNVQTSKRIEAGLPEVSRQPIPEKNDAWSSVDRLEKEQRIESMTPDCPVCGGQMVRRVAKKGVNVGNEFWGCQKFPACRGVR